MRPSPRVFGAACLAVLAWLCAPSLFASVMGSIVGTVHNAQGAPQSGATVTVQGNGVSLSADSKSDGGFAFYDLPIGDYSVRAALSGTASTALSVHVASDARIPVDLALLPAGALGLQTLAAVTVQADRIRINPTASVSSQTITQNQIAALPGGATQSLPKVLYTTNPGFVEGDFGQVFARGNHANIQYDIDGVQLPDSVAGTFGDVFSVLDIDKMETITGGIPAEYGNRLSSVVNIVTKSGATSPGGYLDMNYGSFDTFNPEAVYGGSADGGRLRYFLSGSYDSTERGLDTPEPLSGAVLPGQSSDQAQGGSAAVHDDSTANNEFGKLDYDLDDLDTLSLVAFNAQRSFQIPNYPSTFEPTDAFFSPTYSDSFGNVGGAIWTPADTNDYQLEGTDYLGLSWRHRFLNDSLLQLSPYAKLSSVVFHGDPADDLQAALAGTTTTPVTADSFSEDRQTENLGLQGDYTLRPNGANTVKTGFQVQAAEAHGPIAIEYQSTGESVTSTGTTGSDHDYEEGLYAQDDLTLLPRLLTLNAGLRFDAIEYLFADGTVSKDGELQPRIGLDYTPWDETKFHVYYGKLFQPAPAEDLRDTFSQVDGTLEPYDIKSEKDDYTEVGVAQQVWDQVVGVNSYYKNAVNLLDDTQLLNTAITEPYNYAQGYVYGTEFSLNGRFLDDHFSDFFNYSYEIAQGYGASGGLFALSQSALQQALDGGDDFWQYLDHCQINTANAGLTWKLGGFEAGVTGLYGSGLRTGFDNEVSLPPHFTMDATVSYAITGRPWLEDVKLQVDMTNVFDNVYPIFVDNGFNGSHYTEPRAFMFHVIKAL